jgi:hypothetical protein
MTYLILSILVLLAGCAEGAADGLAFHNHSTNKFWGENSWTNKYKDHNPSKGKTFIGKYFVFLTDGWHLLKLINHLCMFSAIGVSALVPAPSHWYEYVLIGVGCWGLRGLGFTIVYNRF